MYLPDIFRGGEGARQLTFLRGHTNKLWNNQAEMVAKMAQGKMRMANMFSQVMMNTILPMFYLAAVTGTGIFALKKSREEGGLWGMATSQATTGVPVAEDAVNYLRNHQNTPNLPMMQYFKMFLEAMSAKNTKRHPNEQLKKAAEAGGTALGLPVAGVEKLTGWGKDDEAHYKRLHRISQQIRGYINKQEINHYRHWHGNKKDDLQSVGQ